MRTAKTLTITLVLSVVVLCLATDGLAQRGPRGGERPPAGFPTVDAMADAIDADAEQRAVLAEARLEFLESTRERRGPQAGRQRGSQDNPLNAFLVQVGPSLDTQETIALVDLLSETVTKRRRGNEGREGRGHGRQGERGGAGHGHGDEARLIDQLDLSDEQQEAVRALYATTMGGLTALGRQAQGEPTEAQVEAAAALRADHQAKLAEILTDDQESRLATLRAERRVERSTEGAERRAERREKMVADLTVILDLSGSQRAAVEAALDSAEEKAMLERGRRMAEGGPMPHLFFQGEGRELRDETRAAIVDVLEADQRELFARMQALRVEMGRGDGPGRQGAGQPRGQRPRR